MDWMLNQNEAAAIELLAQKQYRFFHPFSTANYDDELYYIRAATIKAQLNRIMFWLGEPYDYEFAQRWKKLQDDLRFIMVLNQ